MKPVRTTFRDLGGFIVGYFEGDRGDTFTFGPAAPVKRADVSHREICVAGSKRIIAAPAGAAPFPIVKAGDTSDARPDLLAGEYVFECLEDGTKCVALCASLMPNFSSAWINLAPGESFTVKRGAVAALGGEYQLAGGTRSGLSRFYASSGDVTIAAITHVRGVAAWPA